MMFECIFVWREREMKNVLTVVLGRYERDLSREKRDLLILETGTSVYDICA